MKDADISVPNLEAVEILRGFVVYPMATNVHGHSLGQVREKTLDLGRFAARQEFDLAVGQIANVAGDVVASRDMMGGCAEADALDPAPVIDAFADCHGPATMLIRELLCRGSRYFSLVAGFVPIYAFLIANRGLSMGKLHDTIKKLVAEENYLVGDHASERLLERGIMEWQAVAALEDGELIAERPKTKPNPTIEVKETLPDGTEFKAVWSLLRQSNVAKLVTVHFFDKG